MTACELESQSQNSLLQGHNRRVDGEVVGVNTSVYNLAASEPTWLLLAFLSWWTEAED